MALMRLDSVGKVGLLRHWAGIAQVVCSDTESIFAIVVQPELVCGPQSWCHSNARAQTVLMVLCEVFWIVKLRTYLHAIVGKDFVSRRSVEDAPTHWSQTDVFFSLLTAFRFGR